MGEAGRPDGVTMLEAAEATLLPLAFPATTEKV